MSSPLLQRPVLAWRGVRTHVSPWVTSGSIQSSRAINPSSSGLLQSHEAGVTHLHTQQPSGAAVSEQQQQPDDAAAAAAAAAPLVDDWCQRSRLLVGADGLQKLAALNVLLVGLGGVGSFAAEFLCRAGVGRMTIVDGDSVDTTNRNRQLPALRSTVGLLKTQVVAQRLADINPDLQLTVHQEFLDPLRAAALVQEQTYDYVIDCIDSIAPKQALLLAGHAAGVATISSMGAGGRLDPSRVRLVDISATYNDAFAAVVRKRLRKEGVASGISVVFSDEPAKPASLALTQQQYKRSYFGTSSYIPALFGLYIASHVIRSAVEPGYQLPKATPVSSRDRGSSSSSSNSNRKHRRSSTRSRTNSIELGSSSLGSMNSTVSSETLSSSSSSSPQERAASPQSQAASQQQSQQMFASFGQATGSGMGFDGEGL